MLTILSKVKLFNWILKCIKQEPLPGYERNVQNSLFGALVHSRVSPQVSMHIKLSIPDLPENRPREIHIPKQLEV